ncbi:MAG: hypothetical protein HFJ46_00440 [Clostridia bacterium]|nr:hypothetical protein [Clostridia bacterium]
MEERSLKVLANDTTFLSKISDTLTKLLIPTKIGINGMIINIKRNTTLKTFEIYKELENSNDVEKKEQSKNRYEESYTLYLESIDRYIMDSIYKKVKNNTATMFEKNALSNYYTIVHLKDNEYLEYKYRKQKFLLELDYENIVASEKDKLIGRFKKLYIEKADVLYKGILKNYSVKLADGIKAKNTNQTEVYRNIFNTLEEYIKNILPLKLEEDTNNTYSKIIKEYEEYEKFSVGKLDEKDFVEKNMILLGLSRVLFTHSLPLVAAEQCYNKLLRDTRNLIVNTKSKEKKEEVYQILLRLIEDYNVKLLSTKVYWDKPEDRNDYKKFWEAYSKSKVSEEKEILSLKRELHDTEENTEKYKEVRSFYKVKLVELGVMRVLKNSFKKTENYRFVRIKQRG